MTAKEEFIEELEDNAREMGVDHIKEIINCLDSSKPHTKTYDVGDGHKVKVTITVIEPTVE